MFLPAIAQQPGVKVRGPAYSAPFDGRVLWVFDAAYAQSDPARVVASSSYALSSLEHPFVLDEASDSQLPTTFLPELAQDRAQVGADVQLSYELGNPLALPLGGTLLFYAIHARIDASTTMQLGTRVARLTGGRPISPESEPELVFPGSGPSFRTSVATDEGHAYLYGCAPSNAEGHDCKLARVALSAVSEPAAYQYRTVGGWSNDVTAATVVVANLSATLSVSYNAYLQGFLLTSFVPNSQRITLQSAPRPEGPWTELGQVTVPSRADVSGLPMYAIEHAELSRNCGKSLLLTYVAPLADDQAELRPVQVDLR